MLGLFKSKKDKLHDKYQKLMSEAHRLSTVNRAKSDQKIVEADAVLKAIEQLKS